MRNLSLFIIAVCCALCASSCRKSSSTQVKTLIDSVYAPVSPDYTVLKPGNYWIYQTYQVTADSAKTVAGLIDSFYVAKDTAIGSNTYHKLVKAIRYMDDTSAYYLRDSSTYVVTNTGQIIFSSQDFTTVFQTIPYTNPVAGVIDTIPVTMQMGFKDSVTSVPIGIFPTCTYRKIYHFSAPNQPKEYDWKYAKNIGLVLQTIAIYTYPGAPSYEDRLIRYHVQ